MLKNSDKITALVKSETPYSELKALRAFPPFAGIIRSYLAELSRVIMADKDAKAFPDVITFGYFCRRANIEKLMKDYGEKLNNRLGRGVSFHIAPSNVPINFAYSLVAGLLAGNTCIVRVSSKPFAQTDIVCRAINEVFENPEFSELKDYIAVIKYEHDQGITDDLSSISDVRIIWGGDSTIEIIRRSPLPPRSLDITFADRYSLCVINADSVLSHENMQRLAQDFYNDTYLFDQNACSAPRLIYWLGDKDAISSAKGKFWQAIHEYTSQRYDIEPVIAVDKYTNSFRCAVGLDGAKIIPMRDNLITRIQVARLTTDIPDYRSPGGSFIEYDDIDLSALKSIVDRKYQTLSYFGLNPVEIKNWLLQNGLPGIDRIVPIGKTADFSLLWDGYDLMQTLTRNVDAF